MSKTTVGLQNNLLAALPEAVQARLSPRLELVDKPLGG